MNKKRFNIGDAYQFMMWASEAYPKVFKEWVMINDIQKSVEDNDYPFLHAPIRPEGKEVDYHGNE